MITGKRRTIGVFMCKAYSMFDNAVFLKLEEEAKRFDYDIIIFTTVGYFASQNDYDSQELGMFAFAPIEELDGIIIAPDTYEIEGFREELFEEIRNRARCPVVTIRHHSNEFDCVYTDESKALRPLLQHLINHHRLKRICFLAGYEGHPDSELRLNVYREEMAANGLPVDEKRDIFHGNMWLNCGPSAYEALFSDPERQPEAVVCANDYMAVGLMRTLQEHGIRVPEDVIVTGFDNVPTVSAVHGHQYPEERRQRSAAVRDEYSLQTDPGRRAEENRGKQQKRDRGEADPRRELRVRPPGRGLLHPPER